MSYNRHPNRMIYLDNAATSFPKPRPVLRELLSHITAPMGNPGRSGHRLSQDASRLLYHTRESLAKLCGLEKEEQIVLCSGATAALNMAILGVCRSIGKHGQPLVVTSVFEHNSVLRPLFSLEREGRIRLMILSPGRDGNLSSQHLLAINPQVVVLTCRSNITGHSFPLRNTLEVLRRRGCIVIMDAAQAMGSGTCTLENCGADILCAPGHKGLMGIMGAGFLAIRPSCPILPEPIFSGGSGSASFDTAMPEYLPERLEAGTPCLPAIVAMGAGADFVFREGPDAILQKEREAKKTLLEGLFSLPRYRVYEPDYPDGPLLLNHRDHLPEETAALLEERGVLVRAGYHCAPLAHRYLGTEQTGAVRLSPGPFTTREELSATLAALAAI